MVRKRNNEENKNVSRDSKGRVQKGSQLAKGAKHNFEYHSTKTWGATAKCKGCGQSFSESSTVSQQAANDAVRSAFEQHVQNKHSGPLTGK